MIDLFLTWSGFAALLAVLLAGVVQGATGFGFNMLAAPLLAMIDPAFVPGAMLLLATGVTIAGTWQERADIHWSDLSVTLTARALAAILAAFVIGLLSTETFSAIFGFAVLLAVAISLVGVVPQLNRLNLFCAAAVSGVMGTLTSIGSPPMAWVYQTADPKHMRATLNGYFLFGGLISMTALSIAGRFGRHDIQLALYLLPVAFAGYLLSFWARRYLTKKRVRPVVLIVSALSAVVLLIKAFA